MTNAMSRFCYVCLAVRLHSMAKWAVLRLTRSPTKRTIFAPSEDDDALS
jgi:hypothetical protein